MFYNTNKLHGYEYQWFRRPLLHIVVVWCGSDRKRNLNTWLRVMKGGLWSKKNVSHCWRWAESARERERERESDCYKHNYADTVGHLNTCDTRPGHCRTGDYHILYRPRSARLTLTIQVVRNIAGQKLCWDKIAKVWILIITETNCWG